MEKKEIGDLIPGLSKIEVIPNGVQIPLEYSNKISEKQYVLYLGRISWKKRIDSLIQAMQYIPHHDLVIAGNDEENLLPKLQKLALDLGLTSRVHFVGSVTGAKKDDLLQSARILALPSLNENFGNVVLESLASSRPVALTKGVALLEEVLLANAGIKLSDNPKEMGLQLNSHLNSQDNLNKMGQNGLNLVKNKYQWTSVAKLTIEAYVKNTNTLSK
jgi:glycosyltransferase involved in cell wall biosynthesis